MFPMVAEAMGQGVEVCGSVDERGEGGIGNSTDGIVVEQTSFLKIFISDAAAIKRVAFTL